MATARNFASGLLEVAADQVEPDFLTPMQLQKLLYYVQGWSLALRNRPAFADRIEAWKHGPVIPDVYHMLKQYGNNPVVDLQGVPSAELSAEDRYLTCAVYRRYAGFTAAQLRYKTHNEQPWIEARSGCHADENSSAEISSELMRAFFSAQPAESLRRDLSRHIDWKTESDADFLKASQAVFLQHGEILNRLGQ